jgi:hypothetical protein
VRREAEGARETIATSSAVNPKALNEMGDGPFRNNRFCQTWAKRSGFSCKLFF